MVDEIARREQFTDSDGSIGHDVVPLLGCAMARSGAASSLLQISNPMTGSDLPALFPE
ncbi:MAG: hypothetical protein GY929_17375 [Actinomycetia bacterium]|nr:hypothetical protein [Actinomycetes bacterium]